MESFGLSPDKVEKLYHQALRLNQLTYQNNYNPVKKTNGADSNKVGSRSTLDKGKSAVTQGMSRSDPYPPMFDQPFQEWEVFKYGDDYGFKDLPTSEPCTSSPKNTNQDCIEHNSENRLASSNSSDLQSSGDQSTSEDDRLNPDFISVLDNAEVIGEKFVKEIKSMKKLFSSNDTFKNQFEKVFCSLRREKIKLEIDLLQAKRCIESLKNQLVIVQEEADQCRRELEEERGNSNGRMAKLMKRYTETKNLLEKAHKQLAIRRSNVSKENQKSNSHQNPSVETESVKENGEPMEETAGSPESCEEAQDDSVRSRNGKSPASSSSIDMNSGINGDCDPKEETDLSNGFHPLNLTSSVPMEPFEVSIEEMGLDTLPSEANDPCICAAIVMTKGRVILHNLKRSEYLATIYEYRKYRPEFTKRQGLPLDPSEEEYDFVNMLPGLWFNSNIDGWFIGNETPEERNKPHPRLPDYILLEGLIPVEKSLYVQNVVMKEDVKHATQVASVLVRRVLPDVYVRNALLSGNTLKDEYPPAKCFIESLANGLPLGVGYRRFLAIQAHAFRVIGKYGPLSYIEIQAVRTTISKCLKERRRDDRRSGLKRKRSVTVLPFTGV